PEDGRHVTLHARLGDGRIEVGADTRIAREIVANVGFGFLHRHPELPRSPSRSHAVDDAVVDDLGETAAIRYGQPAEDVGGGARVYVLAAGERLDERRVVRQV